MIDHLLGELYWNELERIILHSLTLTHKNIPLFTNSDRDALGARTYFSNAVDMVIDLSNQKMNPDLVNTKLEEKALRITKFLIHDMEFLKRILLYKVDSSYYPAGDLDFLARVTERAEILSRLKLENNLQVIYKEIKP